MSFSIDHTLLESARAVLAGRQRLYWLVGGAGSGKTTVCRFLSEADGVLVYDMDSHIYGSYQARFSQERHPVNTAWSSAKDGLAWLLAMSWDEFNEFNQAALPEYLDLLSAELRGADPNASVLIDGGIANPALVAQVISPSQIVCLQRPGRYTAEVWDESEERRGMKAAVRRLTDDDRAWEKFVEFDRLITETILEECRQHQIAICSRVEGETVAAVSARVAGLLGMR